VKAAILETLGQVAGIAERVGLATMARDIRDVEIPKVDEERFNLVVLGEFNHGKSTFVNRLLGKDVLPVGITPTTAALTHVIWGQHPAARAVLKDGGAEALDPKRLADWVTVGGNAERVRYVELAWPADLLRERVTLVDTPGVNDISEQRAEITYGYVPRADAVVFLLDATQILKESEREFLQQRVLVRAREKLVFAVAKSDLLEEDELRQAVAYAQAHLSRILAEPQVFAISAKTGMGMEALSAHLGRLLREDRQRHLFDHAIGDGLRRAVFVRQSIGMRQRALDLGLEELEGRVGEVRKHLEVTTRELRDHAERIRTEAEAIKAVALSDLDEFRTAFRTALPAEIDVAEAGDVKRYLQAFIQDTFKEWAEREGEKIGGRLEQLAEEIISLTNENVRDTMEALQAAFGPADTKVDLEVDTLKYDVGVFALGAFGTTIFLFVNVFIGGLLALSAPILAVVFKSRVDREVKEQARKRAPEVIDRAAAALGPKLAATVDEFADRLQEFVTAAGSALARSVEEVLARALEERRRAGADAQADRNQLGAQAAEVAAIEQRLGALRDELWASSTD
jgi:small GTP-binding protein